MSTASPLAPLTVLYTAQLAGRLDLLPRLFTLIKAARTAAPGPVLLLDLGGACDPAAWECAATQGRAGLLALEALGYDVALLSAADCAALTPPALARLTERVSLALAGHVAASGLLPNLPGAVLWTRQGWRVACAASDAPATPDAMLIVRPAAVESPTVEGAARMLWLPSGDVVRDALGVAVLTAQGNMVSLTEAAVQPIPADLRPDPTATAAVAFVRDEARFYLARQPEGDAHAADETG